ncbi:MAG: LamG domain-containing protein, partial [Herbiconiux sp.]|nr:LamG domain-containing protein [Herbiconiux sp.]
MPYAITGPTAIYTATPPTHTNSFDNGNVDYTITSAPDPIMQFMGQIHSALNGNSERIYLPFLGGGWRSTTTIGFYARTHVDITSGKSPGKAAIMAYGPAYGNPAYGTVLYQGSHISEKNNGGVAEWVGEARLFGNYLMQSAIKTSKVANAGVDQSSICGTNIFNLDANIPVEGSTGTWSIETGPAGGGEIFSNVNSPSSTFYSPHEGTYSLRWTMGSVCASWDWDNITITASNCSTLDFDGVDDYINAGNNYAGNYSFEAWIRPKTASGTILSKRNSLNSGAGYELILNNSKPTFRWNGASVSSIYDLTLNNRWVHIAVSFNGTQATMYIDGILAGTNSGVALTNSASPFLIGASYSLGTKLTSNHFNGWIDEVRIWNEALTVDQIRFMMNQRLQNNTNIGVEIPIPVPGNLSFSKLEGYYRLISENCDPENLVPFDPALKPMNGFTPNIVNINAPGRLHNMTTNQQNTAPV